MTIGVAGFGCEDALNHLLNYIWPNIFENSPHVCQAVHACLEGMRVSLGPIRILQYSLQVNSRPKGYFRSIWRHKRDKSDHDVLQTPFYWMAIYSESVDKLRYNFVRKSLLEIKVVSIWAVKSHFCRYYSSHRYKLHMCLNTGSRSVDMYSSGRYTPDLRYPHLNRFLVFLHKQKLTLKLCITAI